MTIRGIAAIVVAVMTAGSAAAQQVEHASGPAIVQSTVVLEGTTIQNGGVAKPQSGITINGRSESGAERARRDAVDTLSQGTAIAGKVPPESVTATTVVVTGATTVTGTAKDVACLQIGVIGTQDQCRPSPR